MLVELLDSRIRSTGTCVGGRHTYINSYGERKNYCVMCRQTVRGIKRSQRMKYKIKRLAKEGGTPRQQTKILQRSVGSLDNWAVFDKDHKMLAFQVNTICLADFRKIIYEDVEPHYMWSHPWGQWEASKKNFYIVIGYGRRWLDWVLNRSYCSHLYLDKDADRVLREGAWIDLSSPVPNMIWQASVLVRYIFEYPERVKAWTEYVENHGLTETEAFALCHIYAAKPGANGSLSTVQQQVTGHTAVDLFASKKAYRNAAQGSVSNKGSNILEKKRIFWVRASGVFDEELATLILPEVGTCKEVLGVDIFGNRVLGGKFSPKKCHERILEINGLEMRDG